MTTALKAEEQGVHQPPFPVAPGQNWRVFPRLSQQREILPSQAWPKSHGTSEAEMPEMV